MSRYRITIRHAPGNRGDRRKYAELDAGSIEEAAMIALDELDYEPSTDDITCPWEGDNEPIDRQLRRMRAPMLPGLE